MMRVDVYIYIYMSLSFSLSLHVFHRLLVEHWCEWVSHHIGLRENPRLCILFSIYLSPLSCSPHHQGPGDVIDGSPSPLPSPPPFLNRDLKRLSHGYPPVGLDYSVQRWGRGDERFGNSVGRRSVGREQRLLFKNLSTPPLSSLSSFSSRAVEFFASLFLLINCLRGKWRIRCQSPVGGRGRNKHSTASAVGVVDALANRN